MEDDANPERDDKCTLGLILRVEIEDVKDICEELTSRFGATIAVKKLSSDRLYITHYNQNTGKGKQYPDNDG
jgi:hypothetical protein